MQILCRYENWGDAGIFFRGTIVPAFKYNAQQSVIRLQRGEPKYLKELQQICDISRAEFDRLYKWHGVHLEEMDFIIQLFGNLPVTFSQLQNLTDLVE